MQVDDEEEGVEGESNSEGGESSDDENDDGKKGTSIHGDEDKMENVMNVINGDIVNGISGNKVNELVEFWASEEGMSYKEFLDNC
nr:hypothetical protein [Tanacetum cinerariifolium]